MANCNQDTILLLHKPLYGIRAPAKLWNDTLNSTLIELGLIQATSDSCVFYAKTPQDYIIVNYVDENYINNVINGLQKRFKLRDLGIPSKYLGVEIYTESNKLLLS